MFYLDESKQPHSIVVTRGKVGRNINQLMLDYRKLMSPYTGPALYCNSMSHLIYVNKMS